MNTISIIIYNSILFLFPMFAYFLYVAYAKTYGKKRKNIFFQFALYTSMYLYLKYSAMTNNNYWLLLLSLPVIIAFLKKHFITGMILSFIVAYYYYKSNIPEIIYIIELIIYLISYFVCYIRKYNENKSFQIYIIIQAIFLGFFLVFLNQPTTDASFIVGVIIPAVVTLIIMILCYYLLKQAEVIIDLQDTVSELKREKGVRESLFKITHEIKNPIAVCKGYLDMFDADDCDKSRRYTLIMKQEIDRCLMLMEDFLDFSKIKINETLIDIDLLIEDAKDSIKSLFELNNVIFKYTPPENEIYIMGDYDRLKQVFINLIKNSIESLSINNQGIITIDLNIMNEEIVIKVSDNGKGMSKEVFKNSGTPFYTTKKNGTGLGVCVSKEIINAHGGTIKYFSKENIGTKVMIKLPLYKEKS